MRANSLKRVEVETGVNLPLKRAMIVMKVKFLFLSLSSLHKVSTGDDWDELERKAAKGNKATILICRFLFYILVADQKRADGKKPVGSDDSGDERRKKKSAANGKSKSKR